MHPVSEKFVAVPWQTINAKDWLGWRTTGLSLGISRSRRARAPRYDVDEAFVNTLKREYVRVTPLPDAETVLGSIAGWIDDYNENHPHSELRMRSPREFIKAQTETA